MFRGADTVWKLKKAVRLGFLDFTDPAERRRLLHRELELNAPHAPGLYRDVVPVSRSDGTVLDWVLRMAPVPPSDILDARTAFPAPLLVALADAVAAMHAAQPTVPGLHPPSRMASVARGNAAAARAAGLPEPAIRAWEAAFAAVLATAAPVLQARAPLIRRAHGDLHLGNLLLWEGRPVPFDALEFDEDLATIDPAYDLAFLLMDLERRAGRPAANAVLNRYVARTGDAGLVAALRPFLSLRALIRAHVEAARGRDAAALLRQSLDHLRSPASDVVVALGGLPGTGKSTLARALAPSLAPAPGALVLRSDETRKRLAGVPPEHRLPPGSYGPGPLLAAVEDALLRAVAATAPHPLVLDATFAGPGLRARLADAARAAGRPLLAVWLHAPLPELERRVLLRRDDASDADRAVLRAAAARDAGPPPGWIPVEATDAAAALGEVQSHLRML